MDDLAILLEAQQAGFIFDKMAQAADALLRVAKAFGLEVNLAAGKTEAVVGLHGPGTREARQHLAALEAPQKDGSRLPVLPIRPGCSLRIVDASKHFGRHAAASSRMTKMVNYRCSSAAAATVALSRRVFAARGLSAEDGGHVSPRRALVPGCCTVLAPGSC